MWKNSRNERRCFPKNDLKKEEGCAPKVRFLLTGLHLDAAQEILTPMSIVYPPPPCNLSVMNNTIESCQIRFTDRRYENPGNSGGTAIEWNA